jgi:hypothetical protein
MMEFLEIAAVNRKNRLFGTACCHRVLHLLEGEGYRRGVATLELRTEGRSSHEDEQELLNLLARSPLWLIPSEPTEAARCYAARVIRAVASGSYREAAFDARQALAQSHASEMPGVDVKARWGIEARVQAQLLRDIFGNPFHPVAFSPEWRTDTAIALARQIYESRDFGAMPILADALQDAGCENEDILTHCRNVNATHVRGCWVVDLVLGRS